MNRIDEIRQEFAKTGKLSDDDLIYSIAVLKKLVHALELAGNTYKLALFVARQDLASCLSFAEARNLKLEA